MKRVIGFLLLVSSMVYAQREPVEVIELQYTRPGEPGKLDIGLMRGSITVTGHDRPDIVIKVFPGEREDHGERQESHGKKAGLKLVKTLSGGVEVTERNNRASISGTGFNNTTDLEILVPRHTDLEMGVTMGDLLAKGLIGEIEASTTNGKVTLTDISGSVVANAINGNVLVSLTQMTTNKAMAFTSVSGDIDLTLPQGSKANFRITSHFGEVYSGLDMDLKQDVIKSKEDNREAGGGFAYRMEKILTGELGKGGPQITIETMNGTVYLRKKE